MKHKVLTLFPCLMSLLALIAVLCPGAKESNENRTMATFGMVFHPEKDSVVYRDSPVERLNAALSDQFPFREPLSRFYLKLFNALENCSSRCAAWLLGGKDNPYALHTVGKYERIGNTGYITRFPAMEPLDGLLVDGRVGQIRLLHEKYPALKLYVYYVTQAYDLPWFDAGIGVKSVDCGKQLLDAMPPYVKTGRLVYKGLDDYMDIHYKSDHHWNHRGAQRGYEDIYAMMAEDFDFGPILTPRSECNVSKEFGVVYVGRYGKTLGELYKDDFDEFSFFEYDLPPRTCAVCRPGSWEETGIVSMGMHEAYKSGDINTNRLFDHYVHLYGTAVDDAGKEHSDGKCLFIVRNSRGNGKNLLICGDSYNRALRDLLASHFDTTVYFDYRLFSVLPVDSIIEQYGIDALLWSGGRGMWSGGEYAFVFEGGE